MTVGGNQRTHACTGLTCKLHAERAGIQTHEILTTGQRCYHLLHHAAPARKLLSWQKRSVQVYFEIFKEQKSLIYGSPLMLLRGNFNVIYLLVKDKQIINYNFLS